MQPLSSDTPAPPVRYRRLPGSGAHLFNRVRLYLGPDHLLQVTTTGYSESYKRFFFGDIQVLSLHRTAHGTISDVIWGALLAVVSALALSGTEAWPFWAGASGVIAAILVRSWFAGPTCACYVQTAVQRQRLYSLGRLRRARRVFGQLRSAITAAQSPPSAPASPAAAPPPGGEPPS